MAQRTTPRRERGESLPQCNRFVAKPEEAAWAVQSNAWQIGFLKELQLNDGV